MFKTILPHLIALAIFLTSCVIYFSPQLEGKVVVQGDYVQYKGMAQEAAEYKAQTGENTLWTNAMFGGMPTYQINASAEGNLLQYLNRVLELGINRPIGRFFLSMLCFYILMLSLKVNPWLGVVGALAFGFSTNNLVLYEAGHVTKLHAIGYLPLLVAGMLLAYRKQYLLGGILFALGVGLNVFANHVQMTYYFGLTLVIYGVARLIYDARSEEIFSFLKASGVLVLAGLIGLASSAVNLLTTYEYSQQTMRGKPILERTSTVQEPESSSETDGLAWDYAMQWSNNSLDLFAAFIPGVVGGGSGEKVGESSEFYQLLKRNNVVRGSETQAPLYWGALPFTSGPIYFGAIVCFLFVLGLLTVKGPEKWWLALGVLLTMLLSMGKNLEGFNRFFFDVVPLYNKFRTPNSILSVTVLLVTLFGTLGLSSLLQGAWSKQQAFQKLYISLGISGAIALFFALLGNSFFEFSSPGDARYEQAGPEVLGAIMSDRKALMQSDALRTLLLVLLAGGLIWAYLKNYIKQPVLIIALGVFTFFDLFSVGRRYLDGDDFVSKRNYEGNFQPRQVDQQILAAEPHRGAYRVIDYSISTFNGSSTSYFHNTVGGYHAAKLQRIQDIIDRHISQQNPYVLNMLNAKYAIFGEPGKEQVQQNPSALGNAWFIDTLQLVASANAEIDSLANFNPATTAFIHQEFSSYINGFDPSPEGTITLSEYRPNHLTYQSNSNSEQFALFSEVWYGPNKGWQAYLDGNPVEHIRANYILRAMRVPAGSHTIEFKFEPKTYYLGRTISLVASLSILLSLLAFMVLNWKKWITTAPVLTPPTTPSTDTSANSSSKAGSKTVNGKEKRKK